MLLAKWNLNLELPDDAGTFPRGETAEAGAGANNAGIDGYLNVEDQSVSYEINLAKDYEKDKSARLKFQRN